MFSIIKKLTDMFAVEFDNFYNLYIDAYPEMNKHLDIFTKIKKELKNISNDLNWNKELKEELVQFLKTMCELVLDDDYDVCLYTFLQSLKQYLPKHFWWINVDNSFLVLTQIWLSKDMIMDVLVGLD